jgi:hypothetical protein
MVGASATLDCINPPWIGVRCPTLVRFRDINDPRTIDVVDPADLTASFGPNIRLKSVTVQITDKPVTYTNIDQILPYADAGKDFAKWYASLPFSDQNRLGPDDFYQGLSQ